MFILSMIGTGFLGALMYTVFSKVGKTETDAKYAMMAFVVSMMLFAALSKLLGMI